jgi:hypothetical protein
MCIEEKFIAISMIRYQIKIKFTNKQEKEQQKDKKKRMLKK